MTVSALQSKRHDMPCRPETWGGSKTPLGLLVFTRALSPLHARQRVRLNQSVVRRFGRHAFLFECVGLTSLQITLGPIADKIKALTTLE